MNKLKKKMKGKKMIGEIKKEVREAIFETLPVEFSVLDKNDNVLAWNKHDTRIFKRPVNVIGKNVRNCHPEKSLAKVEQIISEMKSGKRDKASFWIDLSIGPEKKKHKILIQYFALKDENDKYIGCLEVSQDISDIQKMTGEKRLLD
jgi:PAS domain S-box-containing protein